MNSLYLILIALCFSAGVLTTVLKTDESKTKTTQIDMKQNEKCNENKTILDTGNEELKPLTIFTK